MTIIIIGIDPGVHTGLARAEGGTLVSVESTSIHRAMEWVRDWHDSAARAGVHLEVWWEDAHQRRWLGTKGREALQGAGSIKRDATIWRDYLDHLGVKHQAVAPAAGNTKWTAEQFAKAYGWTARTNEHARDAGVLAMTGARLAGRVHSGGVVR